MDKYLKVCRFLWMPVLLIFSLMLRPITARADHYQFTDACDKAYTAFMELKMGEASHWLRLAQQDDPENLIPVFLANYADFLPLAFNGEPGQYEQSRNAMEQRLQRLENGPHTSPWYRFCKAGLYFQSAIIHLRFNERLSGANDFRRSYLLLKENHRLFPDFEYNGLLIGLEEAMIGTVPDSYKWLVRILGMKGTIRSGMKKVARFLNHPSNDHLRVEAVVYYCYLKFYLLSERPATWRYIRSHHLDTRNNQLYMYLQAAFALDDNRSDLAIQTLMNRNQGAGVLEVPLFDYLTGKALLSKCDDRALSYLKKFVGSYQGRYFLKDAYQKISYYYLVKGDVANARRYRDEILRHGTTVIDADKQAQRYAEAGRLPDKVLLKARLYCDGGYYENALAEMDKTRPSALATKSDLLEYYYRYGNIYDLQGNPRGAIPFFKKTIELGRYHTSQFAARAAFDLGRIYERQGDPDRAAEYYRLCLSMDDHDFKSSIDQKAKAGLNRMGR